MQKLNCGGSLCGQFEPRPDRDHGTRAKATPRSTPDMVSMCPAPPPRLNLAVVLGDIAGGLTWSLREDMSCRHIAGR